MALAVLGFFFLVRVPPQSSLILRGDPPRVLGPGLQVAPRWLRERVHRRESPAEFQSAAQTDYKVFSADGLEVTVEATVEFAEDAGALARWSQARAGQTPREAVFAALRPAVRAAASQVSARELAGDAGRTASMAQEVASEFPEWAGVHLTRLRFALAESVPADLARRTAQATGRRVLVVGVDAGDWALLRPLMERGELPHFERMWREGASGPLTSIMPLLSPLIWTTIATGVAPERHGVLDFVTTTPEGKVVPVGSTDRRVPALWNLLAPYDKTVSVVGWLATYPAEEVPGTLVSDRFGFLAFAGSFSPDDFDPRMTWPPELVGDAAAYRVRPEEVSRARLREFVNVPAETLDAALAPGFREGRLVNNLVHTLAAAETSRRLGTWLWADRRPDLGLYYFEMVDAVGHLFMPYAPPRLPWISPADVAAYGEAMDAAYRYQDEILGDFLAQADDSTLVLVVSDHGFLSGERRPRGGSRMGEAAAAHWHHPEGIVLLWGAGVRRGAAVGDASVYDVAPTVLAYLGLPVPGDMRGRVWTEAFTVPLATTSLGEDPGPASEDEPAPAGDTELGATALNNLGLSLMSAGKTQEAIARFRQAVAKDPSLLTAHNNLSLALSAQGQVSEARDILAAVVERDPGYANGWMNLGLCELRLKRPERARTALQRAAELEPRDPKIQRNLGFASLEGREFSRAEHAFTLSLELEPHAGAHFGRAMARLEQGDLAAAREDLNAALRIDPNHARAREVLQRLPPGD